MTVATTTRKTTQPGNAINTNWNFAFAVRSAADLQVYYTDAGGVQTLLAANLYSVALNPIPGGQLWAQGGNVTYPLTGTPVPAGASVTVARNVPFTQTSSLINQGGYSPQTTEQALDLLAMGMQQINETIARSLTVPISSTASTALPLPVANAILQWDPTGTMIINGAGAGSIPLPLSTGNGGTGAAQTSASGSLLVGNVGTYTVLPIGAKGSILVADLTQANKMKWKAPGTDGQVLVANAAQNDNLVWTDYARLPLNINPNLLLDQIKEGAAYTQAGAGTTQGPDGVTLEVANTAASISIQQVADPDNAARKAWKLTVNVADAVVDAADRVDLLLALEGYDTSDLSIGTASASQVTVLLKHKLPAGTYGVSIANSAGNRSNVQTIVATGNEMDSPLTFTLDIAGVWLYTTGIGLALRLCLMGGANFQTANTNQWLGANNFTTAAQFNFAGNVANVGYIKKLHVIPGGVALAYHLADIQRELAKAQRQFEKSNDQGVAVGAVSGLGEFGWTQKAATAEQFKLSFSMAKRATPAMTFYSPVTGASGNVRNASAAADVASGAATGIGHTGFVGVGLAGIDTNVYFGHYTANARLA